MRREKGRTYPAEGVCQCRETFEDYLQQAKDGEISAIGVVLVRQDGTISSDYSVDKFIHLDTLVGALEHLKFRILKVIDPE